MKSVLIKSPLSPRVQQQMDDANKIEQSFEVGMRCFCIGVTDDNRMLLLSPKTGRVFPFTNDSFSFYHSNNINSG